MTTRQRTQVSDPLEAVIPTESQPAISFALNISMDFDRDDTKASPTPKRRRPASSSAPDDVDRNSETYAKQQSTRHFRAKSYLPSSRGRIERGLLSSVEASE
jgi:hypothetical protein